MPKIFQQNLPASEAPKQFLYLDCDTVSLSLSHSLTLSLNLFFFQIVLEDPRNLANEAALYDFSFLFVLFFVLFCFVFFSFLFFSFLFFSFLFLFFFFSFSFLFSFLFLFFSFSFFFSFLFFSFFSLILPSLPHKSQMGMDQRICMGAAERHSRHPTIWGKTRV